jgi:hypothetical protein
MEKKIQFYQKEIRKVSHTVFEDIRAKYEVEDIFLAIQNNIPTITEDILMLISLNEKVNIEINELVYILCNQLIENEKRISNNYCFFTGRFRIIYTLINAHNYKNDLVSLNDISLFIKKEKLVEYFQSPYTQNGLYNGRVGILLGLLHFINYTKQESFRDLIDWTTDELIENFKVDKFGLNNFFEDRHIGTLAGFASGNAGTIWGLCQIYQSKADMQLLVIIKAFVESLDGVWSPKMKNWKDNYHHISTSEEHNFLVNNFDDKTSNSFKKPQNNFDFLNGTIGIIISLLAYLSCSKNKDKSALERIENALKSLESHSSDLFISQNCNSLFFIYSSLFQLTNQVEYSLKSLNLLSIPNTSPAQKYSLLNTILNNNHHDFLPKINTNNFSATTLTKKLKLAIFQRYYAKTIALINKIDKEYLKNNLNEKYSQIGLISIENFEKEVISIYQNPATKHRKLIKECFLFENELKKKVLKFDNKAYLKAKEIVLTSKASELLDLNSEEINKIEFVLSKEVYFNLVKWNWADENFLRYLENPKAFKGEYFIMSQIRPIKEEVSSLLITENHVLILKSFLEMTSKVNSKTTYLENFDFKSQQEMSSMEIFFEEIFEYCLYSKIIVIA